MLDAGLAGPVLGGEASPLFGVMSVIVARRANPGMDAEHTTRVYTGAMTAHDKTRNSGGRQGLGWSGPSQQRGYSGGYAAGGRGYQPYAQAGQNQGQWQGGGQQSGGYARQPPPPMAPPRATYHGCWACGMSNHTLDRCRESKDVKGNNIGPGNREAFKFYNCL